MKARIPFFPLLSAVALIAVMPANASPPAGEAPLTTPPDDDAPAQSPRIHDIEGVDVQKMMDQCARMRLKMKPGEALTPEMQKSITECEEMNRNTDAAPAQPGDQRQ